VLGLTLLGTLALAPSFAEAITVVVRPSTAVAGSVVELNDKGGTASKVNVTPSGSSVKIGDTKGIKAPIPLECTLSANGRSVRCTPLILVEFEGSLGGGADQVSFAKGIKVGSELSMGTGNDTFKGTESADEIRGGMGRDRLLGKGGPDKLLGEAGRDSLFGGDGKDFLNGGVGNDSCDGGPGHNSLRSC
jgi:Ca2+-binding RTX toxin-like protein